MSELAPAIFPAREISGELCSILPSAIDPDAVFVLRRLHQAGHRAYLVGGCVRDLLIGGTPKDFDIATSARPRQVKKLFRSARIIGRRFRLVHVMFGPEKQIEVSTFRRAPGEELPEGGEPEPRGRESGDEPARERAEEGDGGDSAPTPEPDAEDEDLLIREDNVYGSEAEDAVRRDFTINGLFYDVRTESVLDYVGGVADLRSRVLRTIGDASRRIREDPVRILRAVKFSTRLGLALDPLLASAMADHHEDLVKSAAPRVFEEILRVLGGAAPERSFEVLVGLGVMRVLFPEFGLPAHGTDEDPRLKRLLARLAALGAIDRGRRSLPTAIYVAVLFYSEIRERMVAAEASASGRHVPPSQAIDDFLHPIAQRCRMAKRDAARVRAMFLALRRIDPELADPRGPRRRRRGGLAEFVRREFFEDALLLMRIVCKAEARDPAPVIEWERRRDELLDSRRNEAPPRPREARPPPEAAAPPPAGPTAPPAAPGSRRRRRRRGRRRGAAPAPHHSERRLEDESEPS